MKLRILFFCTLLVCMNAGAGTMYKWRDADGHIHFTQKPPPAEAVSSDKKSTDGNQNTVESRWSETMKKNAQEFMNNAGVRRVWVDKNGNQVKSRNRY